MENLTQGQQIVTLIARAFMAAVKTGEKQIDLTIYADTIDACIDRSKSESERDVWMKAWSEAFYAIRNAESVEVVEDRLLENLILDRGYISLLTSDFNKLANTGERAYKVKHEEAGADESADERAGSVFFGKTLAGLRGVCGCSACTE